MSSFERIALVVAVVAASMTVSQRLQLLATDPLVLALEALASFMVPWLLMSTLARILLTRLENQEVQESQARPAQEASPGMEQSE